MSRTLLFSVEDTPGNSIEVFVSGNDYGKHIPDLINRLKDLDRICHPNVTIKYIDSTSLVNTKPSIGYYNIPDGPFVPSAIYLEDCDCIDFVLEDEMRVSSPAFADKKGHYIDISKSLDDRIIGLTIWVDVLNEYICLKDVGNTWDCVKSYTFIKKGEEYVLSVWLKDNSIVGFRMVIMQKDIANEIT